MKLSQICLGLLMILIINRPAESSPVALILLVVDLATLIEWGMQICNFINQRNKDRFHAESFAAVLNHIEQLSTDLDAIHSELDIKIDRMVGQLVANIKLQNPIQESKMKIFRYMNRMDHFYDDSKIHKYGGEFSNETIKQFGESVLAYGHGMAALLDGIYNIFLPKHGLSSGFLSDISELTMVNFETDCDQRSSPQQKMFYIYLQLIISEMKGLATLSQIYLTKQMFDTSSKYMNEMEDVKNKYIKHVKGYFDLFKDSLSNLARHIRRCDPSKWVHGVDFIEMINFSRLKFIKMKYRAYNQCYKCAKNDELASKVSSDPNTELAYNCKTHDYPLVFCNAEPGSRRQLLWWEDKEKNVFGGKSNCANKVVMQNPGEESYFPKLVFTTSDCYMCVCYRDLNSIQKNDNITIQQISVMEQLSDIQNDMVVTGVRFVVVDNVVHLQIQQTKFNSSGMPVKGGKWKDVDTVYGQRGRQESKQEKMRYVLLRSNRKTIYLDDIQVPSRMVITGVRLQVVDDDSAFALHVHATSFNFMTGKLQPPGDWYDAKLHPMRKDSDKLKRFEIIMNESDDPAKSSHFTFDFTSKKMIKFTHSDPKKDAAQTTIPYFDMQPVETSPPFPLNGLGLHFRGKDGYGGFISPLIYTVDVSKYLNNLNRKLPSPEK